MAVVFIEGFDNLATGALLVSKGWNSQTSFVISSPGRFDGSLGSVNSAVLKTHALPSSYATVIGGVAIKLSAITANADFYVLQAGATLTARVSVNASGKLQVRNSGGTVIATGTTTLTTAVWYYIELMIFINGASGTCELHLGGISEIASTVGNFGSTNIDTVGVGGITSTNFDDMYVVDTTGAAPRNTFLGEVRVETIFPTSDGAHLAWTPTGGGAHYTQVNDNPSPDGDTTYVSDLTPGDIDTYGFSDIDGAATVFGLQTTLYARKDDVSTRQIAPLIRQSGTDYVGTTITMLSTYLYYMQIYNQDPTAADWTPTTVNGNEYGVKEIA